MHWDLTHILPSLADRDTKPTFDKLEAAVREVESVKGKLDQLTAKDVEQVLHALGRAGEEGRLLYYRGSLAFSVDTTDDAAKTFLERARAVTTEAGNRTRFFTHWLKDIDDAHAKRVTPADRELAYFVHVVRKAKPYTLPEAIEEVIADKDQAGISAVREAREILTSTLRFTDPKTGKPVTQPEITRHVHDADRAIRRKAYEEYFRVHNEHATMLAHIYRAVIRDWGLENLKHRKYPQAMTPMNLSNEVRDDVVMTVLDACSARRGLWQDYFGWKAKVVGEPFTRFDIYAPVPGAELEMDYELSKRTVLSVFGAFHPRMAKLAQRVFDEGHVDAFPGPTKRGGAFCATVQTRMTPYVLLNHTNDARSVSTMAHELGHAVHSMVSADRHPLASSPPLPVAETASVLSELVLFNKLVADHPKDATALLSERVGDLYATIQRQAYFARFEIAAHKMVMDNEDTAALNEAYMALLKEQFGNLEVPELFKTEWMLIPHFNASPFYVSSYSFGALLSLSLYRRYEKDPSFNESILAILSSGGSRDPEELLKEHGIDITSRQFWEGGLDVVAGMVKRLKAS